MLFIFLTLGVFLRLFRFFLLGRKISGVEKLIHHGESGSAAVRLIIIGLGFTGLAEHTAHFVTKGIQILLGEAHLLHHILNLRNTQTAGAAQTIAFIHGNAIFHLGDEHNSDILLTLGTQFRLHTHHYLSWGKSVCGRIPQTDKKCDNKL